MLLDVQILVGWQVHLEASAGDKVARVIHLSCGDAADAHPQIGGLHDALVLSTGCTLCDNAHDILVSGILTVHLHIGHGGGGGLSLLLV